MALDPTDDNDFNPLLPAEAEETPPWSVIMQRYVQQGILDVHTAIPVVVVLVRSTNVVDLQPLILENFAFSPIPLPLPIIQNALVCTPRGSTYGMQLPIKLGDTGLAVFSERSIDVWSVTGGIVDPHDTRHHHLSDAVFFPGLYPFSMPLTADPNPLNFTLYNGIAKLTLEPLGQFKMGNGVVDVLKLLNSTMLQLIQALQQLTLATTNTVFGPQPLNNAAAFATIQTAMTAIQVQMTTLLGV